MVADDLFGPTNGTIEVADDGVVWYTPDADYSGSDAFSYALFDGALWSEPAIVTIDVLPVNDIPVGVAEPLVSVLEDVHFDSDFSVLDNDTDADEK